MGPWAKEWGWLWGAGNGLVPSGDISLNSGNWRLPTPQMERSRFFSRTPWRNSVFHHHDSSLWNAHRAPHVQNCKTVNILLKQLFCDSCGSGTHVSGAVKSPTWRVLAAHPEDLGSIPSRHVVVYNYLQLQFQGTKCPLLASVDTRHTCGAQTYTQAEHSCTQHSKIIKKRKIIAANTPNLLKFWVRTVFLSRLMENCRIFTQGRFSQ